MNINFILHNLESKYDKGLFYEIFINEEYKLLKPYIDKIDTFFDIWAYKWFFSIWLLKNWFKENLILVEPLKHNIKIAKEMIRKFIKINNLKLNWKIKFINAALKSDLSKNKEFVIDLNKPWQSRFNIQIDNKKIYKFFKISNYKINKNITIVSIDNLLTLGKNKIAIKLDIEWEEIPLILKKGRLSKVDLLIFEYHLFNKTLKEKFKKVNFILQQVFKNTFICPSKYTSNIWIYLATNL